MFEEADEHRNARYQFTYAAAYTRSAGGCDAGEFYDRAALW